VKSPRKFFGECGQGIPLRQRFTHIGRNQGERRQNVFEEVFASDHQGPSAIVIVIVIVEGQKISSGATELNILKPRNIESSTTRALLPPALQG
jgi:hypothetical protein